MLEVKTVKNNIDIKNSEIIKPIPPAPKRRPKKRYMIDIEKGKKLKHVKKEEIVEKPKENYYTIDELWYRMAKENVKDVNGDQSKKVETLEEKTIIINHF